MLKLMIQLALGAVVGAVIAIFLFGDGDIAGQLIPLLISAVSVTIAFLVGIVIHELGHLVFGSITGYSFSSFKLGSFVWYKEDGRMRFSRSANFAAGQCLMSPPDNPKDFKFVLYNLGGGIFNILFAVYLFIMVMVAMIVSPGGFWIGQFITGIVVNVFLALANIIPIKSITNDGANIWEALKSTDATRGMYLMLYVNSELTKGKRYRDFDAELFKVSEDADLSNYMVAYVAILEAARLEDLGLHDEFIELCDRLSQKKLPSLYQSLIKADLLYYHMVYAPDFDKAREIYKNKKLQKLFKTNLPVLTKILAAYEFFVLENKEKGLELVDKAKKEAESLPSKGQRLMELEHIEKLEAMMQG